MNSKELSALFDSESQKLVTLLDSMNLDSIDIPLIIKVYYQVIHVSSMITMLKQQPDHQTMSEKIQITQSLISQRFNHTIHPKILEKLSLLIQELAGTLQSENSTSKSKEQIETDAKLFEKLRQSMSTKEFVEQYEIGLSND